MDVPFIRNIRVDLKEMGVDTRNWIGIGIIVAPGDVLERGDIIQPADNVWRVEFADAVCGVALPSLCTRQNIG